MKGANHDKEERGIREKNFQKRLNETGSFIWKIWEN